MKNLQRCHWRITLKKEEYKILLIPSGQRDLDNIKDKNLLLRLKKSMLQLQADPRPQGCIKLLDKEGGYRIRIGDYRYCYRIDDNHKTVYIYRIKHRKEVYR